MPNDFLNLELLKRIGGQENDPFYKDPNKPYSPMDEIIRPSQQGPFSPQNQVGSLPQISSIPGGQEDPDDIGAMIDKLYPQDHAMADKFSAIWEQMPARDKPGKLKHILAAIANVGNPGSADQVLYGDYNRKMEDWTTKLKTLQPAMTDERYGNTNNRLIGSSVLSQRNAENRTKIAQGELDRKSKADEGKADIANKKYELDKFIAEHKDYKLVNDQATGRIMAVNPQKPGEPPIPTGLTFDNFSELEKAKYRLMEAAVPRTINTSGTTTTIGGKENEESPNDKKIREYSQAQEYYNKHPEHQQYIDLGDPGANTFKILEGAPDEVKQLIYNPPRDISLDEPSKGRTTISNRTSVSTRGPVTAPKIGASKTPPPIESRTIGMEFTFPNGNVGKWDGTKWVPVKVVAR